MKKGLKVLSVLSMAVALTFVFAASGLAQDFKCAKMQPTLINANSAWMKNVSGGACGTLANNASRYFLLDSNNSDPLLAILLTALSLNKTVWVHAVADTGNGDTVDVIAVAQ